MEKTLKGYTFSYRNKLNICILSEIENRKCKQEAVFVTKIMLVKLSTQGVKVNFELIQLLR